MRYVGVDIETRGTDPHNPAEAYVWMITITWDNGKSKIWEDCNGIKKCPTELKLVLEDKKICKIIQNALFDAFWFKVMFGVTVVNIWDTHLDEKVIQAVQLPRQKNKTKSPAEEKVWKAHSTGLQYILPRYGFPEPDKSIRQNFINRPLGKKFSPQEKNYAMDDTKCLPALQKAQEYLLTRDGDLEVALLENKMVEKMVTMKVMGVGVDEKLWLEIADQNLQKYNAIIRTLPKIGNWGSPAQVKQYFRNRGIAIDSYDELETTFIKCRDAQLAKLIVARQHYSAATTFGAGWLRDKKTGRSYVDPDGRLRCDWEQVLNTGRMSASKPNLLALPKEGLQRAAIVPARGKCFVIGDFSGQELGIMAAAANDPVWIEALLRGEDIHALTASVISPDEWFRGTERGCKFPKKCECKMHKRMREPAKQENFMMPYGGGPDKLLAKIIEAMFKRGIPTKEECDNIMQPWEAKAFVNKFKRVNKKLTAYLNKCAADALATGVSYSSDPYKRRRVLNGLADWRLENQGKNNPTQSSGANMLKLSIISMPDKFPVVLPFHDEIACEVLIKEGKACMKEMKVVMEQSADYITGIKGLIKVTPRIAYNFMKQ